jgi:2-hydroxymuconate-semialdehyde hydrolase
MRGEFVDVGGVRLYYYAAGTGGEGEPIVFLHGFPTSSHIWRDVVPLVPAGRRMVVVDLLGYGRSDRPDGRDLSIKGHAERVLALLDVLRISFATVVGHDLGGGIAQYLAIRHPTRVARLCLVSSVAFDSWPTREVKIVKATLPLTRFLPSSWVGSVLRSDLLRGYSDEEHGGYSVDMYIRPFEGADGRNTLVEHLAALDPDETEALAPRLKDIVAPTAIITGAHDPFLGIGVAERLHGSITDSTLEVINDVRHFVPEVAPQRVADMIADLVER